ncbi:MAG: IS110 family transposase [Pseudomonadota bacterium]
MNTITTSGLDLAKSVFQFHGNDASGRVVKTRQLRRADVLAFFAKLPPHVVAMEACGTAHHWAREIAQLGHTVKLLPPNQVKPYVRRGKTDAADAEAICEAATRPVIREVPVKTVSQQSMLTRHRCRDLLIRQRTQTMNTIRSLVAEFGTIAAEGHEGMKALLAIITNANDPRVPEAARMALAEPAAVLAAIEIGIAKIDAAIKAELKTCETSARLATIPGVAGLLATAAVATVGDARVFKSGRSFSAWLGLTPRLNGTGGKVTLGPITKKGDSYLRRLLVMGAISMLGQARRYPAKHPKLASLLARTASFKTAAVALANKMARTIWALMVHGGTYVDGHQPAVPAARG